MSGFPPVVLRSSATASDMDSAAKIASAVFQYLIEPDSAAFVALFQVAALHLPFPLGHHRVACEERVAELPTHSSLSTKVFDALLRFLPVVLLRFGGVSVAPVAEAIRSESVGLLVSSMVPPAQNCNEIYPEPLKRSKK